MLQPVSSVLLTSTCLLNENMLSGLSRFCSITRSILSDATSTRCNVLLMCVTVPSSVCVALPQASCLTTSRVSVNMMVNAPTKMIATKSTTSRLRRGASCARGLITSSLSCQFFIGHTSFYHSTLKQHLRGFFHHVWSDTELPSFRVPINLQTECLLEHHLLHHQVGR